MAFKIPSHFEANNSGLGPLLLTEAPLTEDALASFVSQVHRVTCQPHGMETLLLEATRACKIGLARHDKPPSDDFSKRTLRARCGGARQ